MSIPLDVVDRIRRTHAPEVFIETGTHLGHTVEHMLSRFEMVYTIELGKEAAKLARVKFAQHKHVHVIEGDSGVELRRLLFSSVLDNRRALIWLDAHWSGGTTVSLPDKYTPIVDELDALYAAPRNDNVIMIDDISEFTGENGYPPLDELIGRVKEINPLYTVSIDMRLRHGVLTA